MANHTPTPWTATTERDWLEHSCCHDAAITAFEDGKRRMLAEAHSPEDAAFIVKAVNNHEALVKALEAIDDLDEQGRLGRIAREALDALLPTAADVRGILGGPVGNAGSGS